MLTLLAAAALVAQDTSIQVTRGAMLSVYVAHEGVVVRGGSADRVTVRGGRLSMQGNVVTVRAGRDDDDVLVTIPEWMSLRATSIEGDIGISGVAGTVRVESVNGDVTVRQVRGDVHLESISGDIVVTGASGAVKIETVNGDIVVENADGPMAGISTTNGEIAFSGRPQAEGTYSFTTHNGEILLTLPGDLSARMHVATFNGEFETEIPGQTSDRRPVRLAGPPTRREFDVTYGSGSARFAIDAFNGSVLVRRARGR